MKRSAGLIFLSAFLVVACSRAKPDMPQQQLVDVVCISQRDVKLLFASAKGDVQAMQSALNDGADVNSPLLPALGTPLIMAASSGNYEAVQLIIDHGADVNAVDGEGYTPLISAVLSNNKDSVQLLIDKGADVNKERLWTVRGEQARLSPLVIAQHKGNQEIVKLLTDAGAR